MSTSLRCVLHLFSLLVAGAQLASAQDIELAWIPPTTNSSVAGYNVYVSSTIIGPIVATPIDVGRPQVDGAGIARARIPATPAPTLRIEMTSYDSSRRESARSNRVTLVRGPEFLEAPIWSTNFSSFALGVRPPGFGGASFAVTEYPTGNRVLGVAGADGYPISRYTGGSSLVWEPHEISGRMFLQLGSRVAGVAVRVGLLGRNGDPFNGGFRIGSDGTGVFALQSNGGVPLTCANSTSTGVSALVLRWYHFRVRYTEPDERARVRAKVWMAGTAEPAAWQVDCWTNDLPSSESGVFALYRDGWGAVYWDDLQVRTVGGWFDRIPFL